MLLGLGSPDCSSRLSAGLIAAVILTDLDGLVVEEDLKGFQDSGLSLVVLTNEGGQVSNGDLRPILVRPEVFEYNLS